MEEDIRKLIDEYEQYGELYNHDTDIVILKKILAELEKKDRQITKLKNSNKNLLIKLRNRIKEVKKLIKYASYKKEFTTLNKQLHKKDKIIDEMAKAIGHNNDIDYEICDNVHEQGFECDGYSRETNKTCENCIKQYFENKVEENNE